MKSIINLMKEEGIESLDFFYHKSRPAVQKDGNKYEILTIDLTEDNDIELSTIKVYPCYEHVLHHLTVNSSWRKTSVDHIKNIVQQEINKLDL